MKNYGKHMEKNTKNMEYEEAKKKISKYMSMMDAKCRELKKDIQAYDSEILESEEYEYFDRDKALRFIRMWNIIKKKITPTQRNMLCAYEVSNSNVQECLRIFNGTLCNLKNERTLTAMICKCKKMVRRKYDEMYGTEYVESYAENCSRNHHKHNIKEE